tara:strand:+ start:724 stop:1188 length:465 start_codon:yes stop_codon:yes gene_type:complete
MADLILKPASAGDTFKLQNGAGTSVLEVSDNLTSYSKGISENANTLTQSSGTITIDLATGTFFEFTLTENVTGWTFSNVPASGTACAWVIKIKQHASSDKTVAYPDSGTNTVKWSGGADHVMSTGANKEDIISMFTIDGGTNIYATTVGKDFSA